MAQSSLGRFRWVVWLIAALPFICTAHSSAQKQANWDQIAQEASRLLSEYIRVNTSNPPGNEALSATFLRRVLEREGIRVNVWQPARGKANLVARWNGTGNKRAVILLNHMDVVPASPKYWAKDPFAGAIQDAYVWGRGALDMKGMAIAELMALVTLKRQGVQLERDIIFVATSDEEVGGTLGAGDVVRNHFGQVSDAEFVINEAGVLNKVTDEGRLLYLGIDVTEKSPFWLDIIARGSPGHGSQPRENTAPNRLVRALERIRVWQSPITVLAVVEDYFRDIAPLEPMLHPLYADIRKAVQDPVSLARITANPLHNAMLRNTIAITVLSGSNKTNVIPPEARAELDVRLLPGQNPQTFLAELQRIVADDSVEIRPQGIGWPATVSPIDSDLFRAFEEVTRRTDPRALVTTPMVAGFTDCHFFREKGIACYGIDPFKTNESDAGGVHGNDERISIENLRFGTKFLYDVLIEVGK